LESARHLFWERGYAATGMSDILERADARSGSFYHFFQSKEDLLHTVLDSYIDGLHPAVVGPATEGVRDPVDRVFAILARYRLQLIATDCTYGCPIGRLALEIGPADDAARRLIALNFSAWTEVVERFLREASHRFPRGTDFRALSKFVLSVMEGGVMQARAAGSLEPFDDSVRQLKNYFRLLQRKMPRVRRR
jgi:AcrR family transcriptional regulator